MMSVWVLLLLAFIGKKVAFVFGEYWVFEF